MGSLLFVLITADRLCDALMQRQKHLWVYFSSYSTSFSSLKENPSKQTCWEQSEQPHQVVVLVQSRSIASDSDFHRRAPEEELHAYMLYLLHLPSDQAPS